jgi:hypothetical protein
MALAKLAYSTSTLIKEPLLASERAPSASRLRPSVFPVTLWFGQLVDDTFGVEQLQTLERERRAGTVAQQAL